MRGDKYKRALIEWEIIRRKWRCPNYIVEMTTFNDSESLTIYCNDRLIIGKLWMRSFNKKM